MSQTTDIDELNVLIAEDDANIADLLDLYLRDAGFRVLQAAHGERGLQLIEQHRPALVLLDIGLPDIDGFEVCRRLRSSHDRLPIIFLTARTDPADLRSGFIGGGDDYLMKPFRLEELALRVEALLRRSAALGADVDAALRCGPVELDDDAHAVRVDGEPVELSPTEFRLLHYLLLNQGRVVSRQQILDYVWYAQFDGDPSIAERYISYLRRKLGDAGELVVTVRGVGYSMRGGE